MIQEPAFDNDDVIFAIQKALIPHLMNDLSPAEIGRVIETPSYPGRPRFRAAVVKEIAQLKRNPEAWLEEMVRWARRDELLERALAL